MNFAELVAGIASGQITVSGIEHDSRRLRPGVVFVCVVGQRFDGHLFAEQALAAGAAFVVGERSLAYPNYVQVANGRQALADLAYAYYGDHSQTLQQIGITGTNGKSTTCHLLASLLNRASIATGIIGTLGVFLPQDHLLEETHNTTPDAVVMARLLAKLKQQGAKVVTMEMSSMALDQERARNLNFAGVIFTNLTQDHLDYHKTMEAYFQAKKRLFQLPHQQAVINIDDPYGRRLAAEHPNCLTVSLTRPARIRASEVEIRADGLSFLLEIDGRKERLSAPLYGEYNLYNLLFALGGIACLNLDPFAFLDGIPHLTLPEGRWTVIGHSPTVIVDYAHTPDGFEQVLKLARKIAKGKVITIFGCNGNRDREKRPIMADVVSRYSDFIVLTSDNPAWEAPEAIAAETLPGIHAPHLVELDREKAIAAALEQAGADDLVLVLGRGHEVPFNCGEYSYPFYDPEVAQRYWEKRHRSL